MYIRLVNKKTGHTKYFGYQGNCSKGVLFDAWALGYEGFSRHAYKVLSSLYNDEHFVVKCGIGKGVK